MVKEDFQVVLAEDDYDDIELFTKAILEISPNVSIDVTRDGMELIDRLNNIDKKLPDIIFLDLNMPAIDGFDSLKLIRINEKFDTIPIVIFTTSNRYADIKNAYTNGADFYIQKPNSYKDLFEIFENQLHSSTGFQQ
ncbi:MAG: response regulator [Aquimarina sp.]|nr:response regulator [Aquimarina sp.]